MADVAKLQEEVTHAWAATIMVEAQTTRAERGHGRVLPCWLLLIGQLTMWLGRSPFSRASLWSRARPGIWPR
jgi:hypothetical protein